MSAEELEAVRGLLREVEIGYLGPVETARANLEELLGDAPLPDGVEFETRTLGGVPTLAALDPQVSGRRTLLYLHGGAFTIGSAHCYRSFSTTLARAADCVGLSIDYRLAPEHPFPAAVEDCVAAYGALIEQGLDPATIAVAGDSAGGGLVVSLLVAARDAGLPMPAAGVCLSPWADLTCARDSYEAKQPEDVSLRSDELRAMALRYAGDRAVDPLASPVFADLTGLPPLLIHVGSVEILVDDAVALAHRAGSDHVPTTLEVWPGMPHVWHAFGSMLGEGAQATDTVGAFIRRYTGG